MDLRASLDSFGQAEAALLKVSTPYPLDSGKPDTADALAGVVKQWQERYAALAQAKAAVDAQLKALGGKTLVKTYDDKAKEALDQCHKEYDVLLHETAVAGPDAGDNVVAWADGQLKQAFGRIEQGQKQSQLRTELAGMDAEYLDPLEGQGRLYEARFTMYQAAAALFAEAMGPPKVDLLADDIQKTEAATAKAMDTVTGSLNKSPTAPRFKEAAEASQFALLRLAGPDRLYRLVKGVLASAPKSSKDVEANVRAVAAEAKLPPIPRPTIAMTNMDGTALAAEFHPKAAAAVLRGWSAVGIYLAEPPAGAAATAVTRKIRVVSRTDLAAEYSQTQAACAAYVAGYLDYWTRTVPGDLATHQANWKAFNDGATALRETDVSIALENLGKAMLAALKDVQDIAPADAAKGFQDAQGACRPV